jgi:hypothetical protein
VGHGGHAVLTEGATAALTETHISVLVFVGNLAYKLKKPVSFGFVDFSTRAPDRNRAGLRRPRRPPRRRRVLPRAAAVEAALVTG